MPLTDRPDYQAWLERVEFDCFRAYDGTRERSTCEGCGSNLDRRPSPTGLCSLCLAERFGCEQGVAAARVGAAVRVALAVDPGTPLDLIRLEIDDVLDDHELGLSGCPQP